MGKGDKKTRRGKIIIGTFGVRRRHKKTVEPAAKKISASSVREAREKKPVKAKVEVKETSHVEEVKDKVIKEKAAPRTPKTSREKKEATDSVAEAKPKKEKKS